MDYFLFSKLDPTAGGFLQILLNISEQLFYLTPVNGYFYPSLLRKRFKNTHSHQEGI